MSFHPLLLLHISGFCRRVVMGATRYITMLSAASVISIIASDRVAPARSQTSPKPEITADRIQDRFLFQDLVLAPAFTPDPQYLRGIAGGSQPATRTAGVDRTPTGPCVGQVNTLPNHHIYLEDVFESLRLRVVSEGDTTIVVRGPGGTWCNDDYDGNNAGIAGQWLPGAYEIWVGSYKASGFAPYELEFSEVVLPRSSRDRPTLFRR